MLSTWLFFEVPTTENKLLSLPNESLKKIACNSPRQEESFGSCRQFPAINNAAKSDETVKTTSNEENIACEARSAVKSSPVVKSSPQIVKMSRPFFFSFYLIWSEEAYPVVQNYIQGAPRCQTQPKDFGITEIYRVARHLYDPYLPSQSRMEITGL